MNNVNKIEQFIPFKSDIHSKVHVLNQKDWDLIKDISDGLNSSNVESENNDFEETNSLD